MGVSFIDRSLNNIKTSRKGRNTIDFSTLPRLSKSRFQTGLQCFKALHLTCYHPELGDPPTELELATQRAGDQVGAIAREFFPGGELINEDYNDIEGSVQHTLDAMNSDVPAIFEATFFEDNILVKVDCLKRNEDGTYDLIEVKSATSVKNQNITDVGVQAYVLKKAGVPLRNIKLMHLNKDYVYDGKKYDLEKMFNFEDITNVGKEYAQREVRHDLRRMYQTLAKKDCIPDEPIGRQCKSPHPCSFYNYCHSLMPEHPITELPRISEKLLNNLLSDNILAIKDIPDGYDGLTPNQERVRKAVISNNIRIEPSIHDDFNSLKYPLHFVDFETMQTVIPEYEGTRPYQQIPFQWSNHIMDENGNVIHDEFLYTQDSDDPRESFIKSLIKSTGTDDGSIVVYSNFEKQRLQELARDFPKYSKPIQKIIDRLYNLEKTVNQKVYHPEFKGKTSIKYVLPAMVEENDYAGLDITNGGVAMTRYRQAREQGVSSIESQKIFKDLLDYCGVDTMSMVKVFKSLKEMKAGTTPALKKVDVQEQTDDEAPF